MAATLDTTCAIAGGGPAGMMLGFLLARAGVDVVVLEKHADFLRDFRGDTIHPSTLEVMHELGLLDEFLQRPHQEGRHAVGDASAARPSCVADFTPPADALQVTSPSCRNGTSSISSRSTASAIRPSVDDARRGHRPDRGRRPRRRRARDTPDGPTRGPRRCSSSAPTAGTRPCARGRA